jgi:bifunctional DNA-binding transcriptional regulator/antitoxin component of YhaV-PrlF toxin-antitoxin module
MNDLKEIQDITENQGDKKEVTKIFLSGRLSATLIIPIGMARRHGLEKPSHVIVEERQEGILIKKLEL